MDGNERITFWELLDEKKIEIPVIQRDYAQGRDKDNVNDIRKNFLNSIKDALKNEEPLDLNFVYGSTKGNTFIPIDGQQRLTTLYLIHVYLMLVLGKKFEKGSNKRIKKFTYETRTTSRDFCKGLTNETIVIRDDKKITDVESISEEIKNNNWFSSSWLNDPTIKAMLNMLDSIHEIFKGEDYEDFFEKLTDDDEDSYIIYFYFLDLGEYNLGDSIYIKLNARGKDLTNYENFKAKLSKYITDEIGTPKDDYIAKLDGEWSEVFWEFVKDNSTKLYDEKIMNFFTNFMINEYAAYMTASGRDPVRAEIREVIGYSHLDFINRFQGYNDKWDGHKIADSFVKIFELFDLMTSGKNQVIFAQGNKYFDEQALFKWIIENNDTEKADNKSGISYSTRIQADAYLGFIIQNNSLISTPDVFKEKLIDWMRVVMTLSRETNYNGGDDYVRAISKGVRKMLSESGDILTYLDKLTDRSGHGFDGDCFDEECLKAKLILRSPEWEKLVIAAEDNKYFNGQIGFLFEISGIDKQFKNACVDKWDAATDQEYRSLFEKYFNIFSSIFGEFTIAGKNDKYVGINRNIANVLRRALLCKGDYTLFHSSNSSFLIDNDRDISWKRLLRIQSNEKNGTYQNRRKMFFSLIKDPLFDQNDIADSLQKICDRDVAGITDWRKYFITVPEIMDSLHKYTDGRASERYVRFEGKYIFLMGSTRLYGWNEEYYSYALYCLLKKLPNASVKYNQAKGWEDVDCHIELTSSTNAGKWKIKYLRAKDKFSVIDASGVQSLYSTVEDAKYALEKLL